MNYTLKDLLDLPQLRKLLDSLNDTQAASCAILDATGEILAGRLTSEIDARVPGTPPPWPGARAFPTTVQDRGALRGNIGTAKPVTMSSGSATSHG